MPEFTKEEYNQYKQSIIDTGKANNQIGYLYEFYLDNKDNMRFLKTKCYFTWNKAKQWENCLQNFWNK